MLLGTLGVRTFVETNIGRIDPVKIAADYDGPLERPICGSDNPTTWTAARLQALARVAIPLSEGAAITAGARQVSGIDPSFVAVEGLWRMLGIECNVAQLVQALESDVISATGRVPPGAPRHKKVFKLHWHASRPFVEVLEWSALPDTTDVFSYPPSLARFVNNGGEGRHQAFLRESRAGRAHL